MATQHFTKAGAKSTSSVTLPKEVFGLEVENHELLKQAYEMYLANRRTGAAKTLRRGEVRGGGKKPWRQKGTGRARVGSTRSPIWRSGGITFGPLGEENYTKTLPKKAKRLAIRQALSLANKADKVISIDTFETKGKTKETQQLLDKIGAKRKTLLVVSVKDDLVERATNNIPNLKVVQAMYLSVFDIMNSDTVIISKKSLDLIKEWLGESNE